MNNEINGRALSSHYKIKKKNPNVSGKIDEPKMFMDEEK